MRAIAARGFALLLVGFLAHAPVHAQTQPVTDGLGVDYQPAVLRSTDDGARIVVFERLDPATTLGDLWMTRSADSGTTWSDPVPVIATPANERHPALLQVGPSNYVLFYLKSVGSSFRIFRATSTDAATFVEQGAIDLGWSTGGEINPHVIRHHDGTLTMSYQRLSPTGSYVAQSVDNGQTWDTRLTHIANGALPRIAYRERDGLYLASYQVNDGSNLLKMYVRTTRNMYDWSSAAQDFAISGNNHDSLPVVMPDGAFVLFWIRAAGGQFDIVARRSTDAVRWGPVRAITSTPEMDDVEPHALIGDSPGVVELYWGSAPAGTNGYAIVRNPAVVVVDPIFSNSFEE